VKTWFQIFAFKWVNLLPLLTGTQYTVEAVDQLAKALEQRFEEVTR
jgi:hypothetical protein